MIDQSSDDKEENSASLEDTGTGLAYPCEVDVKIFARADETLEQRIGSIVSDYFPAERIIAVTRRDSRKGNYHALSCKVLAYNREELDQLFAGLSEHPDILIVI